jgi:hypothetical protein
MYGMQWWIVALSNGRAESEIIICILRMLKRVLLSAQSFNHIRLVDIAGLNFVT